MDAVGSIARFLAALFVELCQLALVFAGASFGAELAHDHGMPFVGSLPLIGFFAFYSLFVLLPARDLIQGWLGMIAGRQPTRYADRAANLGRATLLVAASSAFWLVPTTRDTDSAEVRAFTFAFYVLAIVVFGIGGAIPRLWFAIRHTGETSSEPQLLREAGLRGGAFVYCAFLGMGLALAVAMAVAYAKGAP